MVGFASVFDVLSIRDCDQSGGGPLGLARILGREGRRIAVHASIAREGKAMRRDPSVPVFSGARVGYRLLLRFQLAKTSLRPPVDKDCFRPRRPCRKSFPAQKGLRELPGDRATVEA
ncbi:hypothetical protein RB2636 [Rhodopirellula baltica SH 1]|uniref:Uncharacterized protein n=2 Tax=Rhodopirellula baltica TaxID=265606 RepID=Q7UVH3_RHOBA|nr:hypothetical protein RB2636 [Rhodopirellula baltica SH 1]